jgi:predicted dinucleotide-binding enzyme
MSVRETALYGDIIVLAVPWRTPEALPEPDAVAGKIVIDAMNPYTEDGQVMDLGDKTSSEVVAKRLPKARLVKAFNTVYYQHLAAEGNVNLPMSQRRVVFVAGDDPEAKQVVMQLIERLGFAPLDTGSLREGGRLQQPGTPIYNRDITAAEADAILGH